MGTGSQRKSGDPELLPGDALVVVDVQRDFLPGGALGVPGGDEVVPVINRQAARFQSAGLPVAASRDWHPAGHCSFTAQGGPWPPHCVAGTPGAELAPGLELPVNAILVSKATSTDEDAYSAFDGTDLAQRLRALGAKRLFVTGIATDYCVLHSALDARRLGFEVVVLADAVRAVNAKPGDGDRALDEMRAAGCAVSSAP